MCIYYFLIITDKSSFLIHDNNFFLFCLFRMSPKAVTTVHVTDNVEPKPLDKQETEVVYNRIKWDMVGYIVFLHCSSLYGAYLFMFVVQWKTAIWSEFLTFIQ